MGYSKGYQDKLSVLNIERQSRPFVDENLQIQLPGLKDPSIASDPSPSSPIYVHYAKYNCSPLPLPPSINEKEINQSMVEAEKAYQAWQQFKHKILQLSKNL
jgi:hypothetical protein